MENKYIKMKFTSAISKFKYITRRSQRDGADGYRSALAHITNKEQAWKDLLTITKNKNWNRVVRWGAASALGFAIVHVTDKEQATKDLLALAKDEDSDVRGGVASALGFAIVHMTDKEQATKDLLALTKDEDSDVRWDAAEALGYAFAHIPDKEQATKDLLALTKDEDSDVRSIAASTLGLAFAHVTDKEQAWKDLLAFTKDEESLVRWEAAEALGLVFTHLTDKEQAWKDLLSLVKDEDGVVRRYAADVLDSALTHVTDKEQATKNLLALVKNKDSYVRRKARLSLFNLARHYLDEKNYEKASQYFYEASIKSTLLEHINPSPFFYSSKGLGSYYHGRVVVNDLSNIEDPKEYTKTVKDAVRLFAKSIKYMEKSSNDDVETSFFPISLNIYSAYYEYILSFQKLDIKRIDKVEKYLDEASEQCRIIGAEKSERIVKIFKKLAEALKSRLKEIELEAEKREGVMKGRGIGEKVRYETSINKSREAFEKHKAELESSLYEIESPTIKKIAELEKKHLEESLKTEEGERLLPKSFWEYSRDFVVHKWKIIMAILAAVAAFLVALTTIIEKWEIISELIRNLI